MLAARQEWGKCGECLGQQGRGGCGEHGQRLILSFGESVQNENCSIFDVKNNNIFKIYYFP